MFLRFVQLIAHSAERARSALYKITVEAWQRRHTGSQGQSESQSTRVYELCQVTVAHCNTTTTRTQNDKAQAGMPAAPSNALCGVRLFAPLPCAFKGGGGGGSALRLPDLELPIRPPARRPWRCQ